jgi:hypothetical protein
MSIVVSDLGLFDLVDMHVDEAAVQSRARDTSSAIRRPLDRARMRAWRRWRWSPTVGSCSVNAERCSPRDPAALAGRPALFRGRHQVSTRNRHSPPCREVSDHPARLEKSRTILVGTRSGWSLPR